MLENRLSIISRTRNKFQQLLTAEDSGSAEHPEQQLVDEAVLLQNTSVHEISSGNENNAFEKDLPSPQRKALPPVKSRRRRKNQPVVWTENETELISGSPLVTSERVVKVKESTNPILDLPSPSKLISQQTRESSELIQIENESIEQESSLNQLNENATEETVLCDGNLILGINIHQTDRLQNNFFIFHPMVKVHLLDERNGNYLKKSDVNRSVTSFYENKSTDSNITYILPVMTQPAQLNQNRICLPKWEELIVFNESFNYVIQQKSTIIFFEVMDFVNPSHPLFNVKEVKEGGGWHYIAWAFFKPVGANGALNTDKRVRLQLFKPVQQDMKNKKTIPVYRWWKKNKRLKYPSTLYLNVKAVQPPEIVLPTNRSMLPVQPEETKSNLLISENGSPVDSPINKGDVKFKQSPPEFSRLAGQFCKIPNCPLTDLQSAAKGCFCVKFSHNGRFLACGCMSESGAIIYVNESLSGDKNIKLEGHDGIIYDLDWFPNDKLLLSASADATVRIWNPACYRKRNPCLTLLPHPSFVYAAKFLNHWKQNVSIRVITGCFDSLIRLWKLDVNTETFDSATSSLLQEIGGHTGSINSFCLASESKTIFSGDSLGRIRLWGFSNNPRTEDSLKDIRSISIKELDGNSINSLDLTVSDRKLVVNSKLKNILVIEVESSSVLYRLERELSSLRFVRGCISPCGSLYFAPGDKGQVYVWNLITNDLSKRIKDLSYQEIVTGIDYHPRQHIVAFCSTEDHAVITVQKYNFSENIKVEHPKTIEEVCGEGSSAPPSVSVDVNEEQRVRMVVQKLDTVMKAVSCFKAKRIVDGSTLNKATVQPSNDVGEKGYGNTNSDLEGSVLQESEESSEKFTAVVNNLGELEIVPSTRPIPKARKKRRERIEASKT